PHHPPRGQDLGGIRPRAESRGPHRGAETEDQRVPDPDPQPHSTGPPGQRGRARRDRLCVAGTGGPAGPRALPPGRRGTGRLRRPRPGGGPAGPVSFPWGPGMGMSPLPHADAPIAACTRVPGLAVIGGGPAGLMAAEAARAAGLEVDVFEAKGSVGRKFLIAGKGGLNLTHGESRPGFDARYRERQREVAAWLDEFDAAALREWAAGLGVETYVGSSGRVFPTDRKAAPLLRGWVRRLRDSGVRFHVQHRWTGWDAHGALRFAAPSGELRVRSAATVLALGGGSWPRLGSDGSW